MVSVAASRQVTLKLVAATPNPANEHALLLWLHTDADPWSVQSVDGTQGCTQEMFRAQKLHGRQQPGSPERRSGRGGGNTHHRLDVEQGRQIITSDEWPTSVDSIATVVDLDVLEDHGLTHVRQVAIPRVSARWMGGGAHPAHV